jgi:putative tryptophan/tyrosine transport system substrate-binding protein
METKFQIRFGVALSEGPKSKIQNRKWAGIVLIMIALTPCSVAAEAQHQPKLFKVGWLDSGPTVRGTRLGEIFLHRLSELGYIEGQNITLEYRSADDNLARLTALAGELVRDNVDVLMTTTTPAALAAKKATKTIPIVFMLLAADPIAAGLVESLARPGGNITGVTNVAAELGGKRLELLKETVLKLTRVCGAVGSAKFRLRAGMEGKPIAGTRTGLAASLHGSKQCR